MLENKMEWQPIETAPIREFNHEQWYMPHSESFLLWGGNYCVIGRYEFTKTGRGKWKHSYGVINPTHWMPLPDAPK